MTEKRFTINTLNGSIDLRDNNEVMTYKQVVDLLNALHEENRELQRHLDVMRSGALTDDKRIKELYDENEQLKSTIAQLIEQNRKNNDLLLSDIRILEKALWCGGCENDYGRLKELRKEFIR